MLHYQLFNLAYNVLKDLMPYSSNLISSNLYLLFKIYARLLPLPEHGK